MNRTLRTRGRLAAVALLGAGALAATATPAGASSHAWTLANSHAWTVAPSAGLAPARAPWTGPRTGDVHVLVRATGDDLRPVEDLVRAAGGTVGRELRIIDAVAATVPAAAIDRLQASPAVREVTENAKVTLASSTYDATGDANSLYNIENVIGARRLWGKGYTGKGVDIALLDSGVAPVAGLGGAGLVVGPDLTPESQNPRTAGLDTYGHGTHLAGIMAGHDPAVTNVAAAESDTTDFLGVAPDARVVSVKAADYHGASDVSQVIAGIDWVVQHAHDNGLNIRVLNLSFGTDSAQSYLVDPLAYAAEQAWKQGIVVVVSAGNSGALNGRMTDPAIDPFVIAVGADDTKGSTSINDDTIPSFSALGDGVRNPDLVAPGVHVQSLRVPGSYVDVKYGATGALADRYFRGSGTSQAAAVVSGSVALLLQQFPTWTPDVVKAGLTGNAAKLPSASPQAQGAGLVWLRSTFTTSLPAPQVFAPSTGTGTLEGSRGSTHLVMSTPTGNVTLSGERDIFGQPVTAASLAALEASASSWSGGVWNSSAWASSAWASSAWASTAWAGSAWAGSAWAGSAWASSAWADATWQSSAWASSAWASSAWASSMWASSAWAGSAWADSTWQSSAWA